MILNASEEVQALREALKPFSQSGCLLDGEQVTNILAWLGTIRALAREAEEEVLILNGALKAQDDRNRGRIRTLRPLGRDDASAKIVPLVARPRFLRASPPDDGDAA
ncbi:hypothetical protein [Rhizobium halophytocola]|uniref:Uncharacterized protein n=1 Tax=Rhizobium halophytocola TaxID=735519 RepID=A0ABS4E474_9HYPH|nr:hypothetical protein [Rhizobium halophytocola]MBP1852711.1 hypothetical protein [Rhizobium halophytocola]